MGQLLVGHLGNAQRMIWAGSDVNVIDKEGNTPLILVSQARYPFATREAIEMLIKAGADVNATNMDGWSSLMFAAKDHNLDVVETLLTCGANVKLRNRNGLTALQIAEDAAIPGKPGRQGFDPSAIIRVLKRAEGV